MSFDFDKEIDRRNTNSVKYDFVEEQNLPADILPLWVADMDFQSPPAVIGALRKSVEHGIFGYSDVKYEYYHAVAAWFKNRFEWETKPEWLVKTPGVVCALATAVRALTVKGDGVLIQPPVYYPFFAVIRDNDRRVIENELVYRSGRYEIDFNDLEEKIERENVKLFILCSPHNPVCRVWTYDELRRIGDICRRHGVYVVSDEIHCDFAFKEHPHTVFAHANPELAEQTVICTAPSKTFNLAGLQVSNIWIPGDDVLNRFKNEIRRSGYSHSLNSLGLVAAHAAYDGGAEWLDECKAYMRKNLDHLRSFLEEKLPEIKLVEPEGTYFAWLDCSGLGLSPEELDDLITNGAKLWLDSGRIFGGSAGQFQRVVLACTRRTLDEALTRLERAVRERRK